jgi:hypothetical protein
MAVHSKQLSTIIKYCLCLVNIMDEIYVKLIPNELDMDLTDLLIKLSEFSSKNFLSKLALN